MPPHLHPRSRMTTSLFTTTLMVSFLVVAAPHLIPCPVDPRTLADSADPTGETRRRRRRRILKAEDDDDDDETCAEGLSEETKRRLALRERLRAPRECPVPKPGGLIGTVLGVGDGEEPRGQISMAKRIEKSICRPWGKGDGS